LFSRSCLYAGIPLISTHASNLPGQWCFRIGGPQCDALRISDCLWVARYILYLIAEEFNLVVSLGETEEEKEKFRLEEFKIFMEVENDATKENNLVDKLKQTLDANVQTIIGFNQMDLIENEDDEITTIVISSNSKMKKERKDDNVKVKETSLLAADGKPIDPYLVMTKILRAIYE
jgi:hypothetical protein